VVVTIPAAVVATGAHTGVFGVKSLLLLCGECGVKGFDGFVTFVGGCGVLGAHFTHLVDALGRGEFLELFTFLGSCFI